MGPLRGGLGAPKRDGFTLSDHPRRSFSSQHSVGWSRIDAIQFALAACTRVVRTRFFTSANRPSSSAAVRGPRTRQRAVS